jgi:hypothetical protein
MTTFTDNYNSLVGMYRGCLVILKLLDDFNFFLNDLIDANSVNISDTDPNSLLKTKNYYEVRKSVYIQVTKYLDDYFKDFGIVDTYSKAYDILKNIKDYFNVLINTKSTISPEFKIYITNIITTWESGLAENLRDLLMATIKTSAVADTNDKKNGSNISTATVETTSAETLALYRTALSEKNNPVVQTNMANLRAEDINRITQEKINVKNQESTEQKGILSKLADGEYLFNVVNSLSSKTPEWLKKPDIANFVLNNLTIHSTLSVAGDKPLDEEQAAKIRTDTRKKIWRYKVL